MSSNSSFFSSGFLKFLALCGIGVIIFGNHYARDVVGALEKQMEEDLPMTSSQYALLNSLFFIPNTVSPFIAGVIVELLGGATRTQLYACIFAAAGHLIFSFGGQTSNLSLIYFGRLLAGIMYEVIDTFPTLILGPLFEKQWNTVVGMLNSFLRLGSVFNFFISPIIYQSFGVRPALWAAAFLACTGVPLAVLVDVSCSTVKARINSSGCSCNVVEKSTKSKASKQTRNGKTRLKSKASDAFEGVEFKRLDTSDELDNETDNEAMDGDTGRRLRSSDSSERNGCHVVRADSAVSELSAKTNELYPESNVRSPIHDVEEGAEELAASTASTSTSLPSIGDLEDRIDLKAGGDSADGAVARDSIENDVRVDDDDDVVAGDSKFVAYLRRNAPAHKLGRQYYYYVLTASCIYGAMVPFWFMGSKFLQNKYHLSIVVADYLMLLPEGVIVIVSPLLGLFIDRYKLSVRTLLAMLVVSCVMLPLSYVILLNGYQTVIQTNGSEQSESTVVTIPPIIPTGLLGVAYAFTNCLMWSLVLPLTPKKYFSLACGIMSSSLNIFPAIIPPLVASHRFFNDDEGVRCLILLTIFGSLSAFFAFLTLQAKSFAEVEEERILAKRIAREQKSRGALPRT